MKINSKYEQEIDLRDLFFHVLYHWRSCLLAALIGAVLLGVALNIKPDAATAEAYRAEAEKYYEEIDNLTQSIEKSKQAISERQDYLDNSIWANIDSRNEWFATRQFLVLADPNAYAELPEESRDLYTDAVLEIYRTSAMSGLEEAEMQSRLGTSEYRFIYELVKIEPERESNTIKITASGKSRADAAAAADYFEERLFARGTEPAQAMCAHTVIPLGADEYRGAFNEERAELLMTYEAEIAAAQLMLEENEETLEAMENAGPPEAPRGHLRRNVVVGLFLGAIFMAVLQILLYIFGGKLHTGNELRKQYGLISYGDFAHSRAFRHGKGIDGLIERWELRDGRPDNDAAYDSTAALIEGSLPGKEVILVSSADTEGVKAAAQKLADRLGDRVQIKTIANFSGDPSAIQAVKGGEPVILLEEKHVSRTDSIQTMAERLLICDANVSGFLTV